MVDWQSHRSEFPALQQSRYFTTSLFGPMSINVHQTLKIWNEELLAYGSTNWLDDLKRVEDVRVAIAESINADADEIAFTDGIAPGMNIIVQVIGPTGDVVAANTEPRQVVAPFQAHRANCLNMIAPDRHGLFPAAKYVENMTPRTSCIVTSYVHTSNGCRTDLHELSKVKNNANLIVDASDGFGAFEMDVKAWGVDALVCCGYKWLCAGYGAGFVYMSKRLLQNSSSVATTRFGRRDLRSKDAAQDYCLLETPPLPCIFALGAAVRYMRRIGIHNIQAHVLHLSKYLTVRMEEVRVVPILSPLLPEKQRSGIILFGVPPGTHDHLARSGIQTIDRKEGIAVCVHYFNTHEDIDCLVDTLLNSLVS